MRPLRLKLILKTLATVAAILAGIVAQVALQAQSGDIEWFSAERDNLTLWHTQGQLRADDLADHGQGA